MKKELELIRKESIIEVCSWGGLSLTPGTTGFIIDKNYNLYYYHMYHRVPLELQDKISLEYLSKPKQIDNKTITKLNNYIEELLNKEYEERLIMDATFHIYINYNNQKLTINNYPELNNKIRKIIERGINNEE